MTVATRAKRHADLFEYRILTWEEIDQYSVEGYHSRSSSRYRSRPRYCARRVRPPNPVASQPAMVSSVPQQRSPEMLHVWLVDRPGAHFATPMFIDPKLIPELVKQRAARRLD